MKQRLLQTLLIALLVPTGAWADAVEIDGIYYNLNTDTKEAELKNPRNKTSESIIIPSTVSYDGVTFNVTSIRNNAFSQCEKLKEVVIPNSITSIGEYAFMYCYNLKDFVIPNSVKTLGMRVFYDCRELGSITIPSSVSSIGSNLFYGCDNLSLVKVDSENSVYDSRDNCNAIIETKENKLIAGSKNTIIPSSITAIKSSAFQGCRGLTSIVIGANITSIGSYVFSNCNNIVSIKVDSGNKVYDSREDCNAIINSTTNELITGCMNTVIPGSASTIGDAAFYGCSGLLLINIPNSITSIGTNAFDKCTSLTSIIIPDGVKRLKFRAFNDCENLNYVIIGSSVTFIESEAFSGCTSLTEIHSKIKTPFSISKNVFYNRNTEGQFTSATLYVPTGTKGLYEATNGWNNFKKIVEKEAGLKVGESFVVNGITYSVTSTSPLEVQVGISDIYNEERIPAIDRSLKTILIPSQVIGTDGCLYSVTRIGRYAFFNCTELTSIGIPNTVSSIGFFSFSGCASLFSFTIPNSVIELDGFTFQRCANLHSIEIPSSCVKIGQSIFSGCTNLASVSLPNSLKSIGYGIFEYCSGLTKVISNIDNPFPVEFDFESFPISDEVMLYVPEGTKAVYEVTKGWKEFKNIVEMGDIPEGQKCAKPTISYSKGKLTFASETEGATCYSTITDSDITSYSGNEVELSVTYIISVYAAKLGYTDSDVATATLCWIDQQPAAEGLADGIANVPAKAMLIQSNGGQLTIEGTNDDERITVYSINGTQAGSAISNDGSAVINTNLQPGNVAIVKIGEKSVKVVVK